MMKIRLYKKLLPAFLITFFSLALKAQDVGVTTIQTPSNGDCGSKKTSILVQVKNYDVSASSAKIPLVISISGGALSAKDTLRRTIAAGQTDTFTFSNTFNSLSGGTYTIKVYTNISGDKSRTNDTATQTVKISQTPDDPSVRDSARCGPGLVVLANKNPTKGAKTFWYLDSKLASLYSTKDTITPYLSQSQTYYVVNTFVTLNNLKGTFTGGNSQQGNIFDIRPSIDLHVDSFDLNIDATGTYGLEFYYKKGSFSGYETSPGYWTKVGSAKVSSRGSGNPTRVYFGNRVAMSKGQVYAFYIRLDTSGTYMDYTNGTGSVAGLDSISNKDLMFWSGLGVAGFFGTNFRPRIWNGNIYYSINGCQSNVLTATATVLPGVNGTDIAKGKTFNGVFAKGTAANPDIVCVGDSVRYDLLKPVSYNQSDYGTKWTVPVLSFQSAKGYSPSTKNLVKPTVSAGGYLAFQPKSTDKDSTYILTAQVKNPITGCDTLMKRYITIYEHPVAGFNLANGCQAKGIAFTNTSTPGPATTGGKIIKYTWYFGNGDTSHRINPNYAYPKPGTYTVSLSANNGSCRDSASKTITIYPNTAGGKFIASSTFHGLFNNGDFDRPDNACARDTLVYEITPPANFTNVDYGTKWKVNSVVFMSSVNKTIITDTFTSRPTSTRNFTVRVIPPAKFADSFLVIKIGISGLTGGCDSNMTRVIQVGTLPKANFNFINVCEGKESTFSDSSYTINHDYLSHHYNFGDGGTATQSNSVHTYSKAGTYTVKETVSTAFGCTDVAVKQVKVYAKPKVKFAATAACAGQSITFRDTTQTEGTVIAYYWKFPNGFTNKTANPSYTFSKAGTYTVTYGVQVSTGCADTVQQTIVVNTLPKASFSVTPGCPGTATKFNNASTGDSLTYFWDFGDGTTSTTKNPQKIYFVSQTSTVKLTAISKTGCTDVYAGTFTTAPNPIAKIGLQAACIGTPVRFTDSSNYVTGPQSRKWNFGDSSVSTSATPSHSYTKAGNYTVTLVITNDKGCQDSTTKSITLYDPPVAAFTAEEVCLGKTTSFTNNSTVSAGTPTYLWDFGDTTTSTAQEPEHTYTRPGSYLVNLTVMAGNCSSKSTSTVTVNAGPTATFAVTRSGRKLSFHPVNTTYTSYLWNFGDSATSTDVSPSHLYSKASGTYHVSVKVTDANGCTSTYSVDYLFNGINTANENRYEVKVYPNPFTGVTHLTYTLDKRSVTKVVLQDINGREVQVVKAAGMETEGQHDVSVDANSLASGVYLLKVIVGDQVYNERIEKLK